MIMGELPETREHQHEAFGRKKLIAYHLLLSRVLFGNKAYLTPLISECKNSGSIHELKSEVLRTIVTP